MTPTNPTPVLLVNDRLGGQCQHSGIHQLARYLGSQGGVRTIETPDTGLRRWVGKAWSVLRRGPIRNQSQSFTELHALLALVGRHPTAVHFLVGENHSHFLAEARSKHRIFATVHMPPTYQVPPLPRTGQVDTLILLSSNGKDRYRGAWGARRTVVVRHGVDTEFFRPDAREQTTETSILIVGRFLRDFPLTAATVVALAARHRDWRFDFVVTQETWFGPDLATVRVLPGARWFDRVDDASLRQRYQRALCLLSPFLDCTANNAVVESLASGLPIVTTDRGGVRDYGAGSVYPLPEAATPEALAELCERYAAERGFRDRIGAACRSFALQELAWPVIAQQHLALYSDQSTPVEN